MYPSFLRRRTGTYPSFRRQRTGTYPSFRRQRTGTSSVVAAVVAVSEVAA